MPTKIRKEILESTWQEDLLRLIYSGQIENITEILPLITPGENIRAALDNILDGQTGAIIILGTNEKLDDIVKGGMKLDVPFTPSRLFELSKMDGAIILSNDLKTILHANAHLMPDRDVSSKETGIRHRSSEQTAKQTGLPVITISKRRNIISLFFKDQKYVLQDLSLLIVKANHGINTLRRYRERVDQALDQLTYNELNNQSSLSEDAISIIQKILYFYVHSFELDNLIIELGNQGREVVQSMYEYAFGLDDVLSLILQDYCEPEINKEEADLLVKKIKLLDLRKITDPKKISEICSIPLDIIDHNLNNEIIYKYPRGYRILSLIPKIKKKTIEKIIYNKKNIYNILNTTPEEISKITDQDINFSNYLKRKLDELVEKSIDSVGL